MIDVQDEIVMCGIAPVLTVERSNEGFLLAIAIVNYFFSRVTIDLSRAHNSRYPIRQWGHNLDMKGGGDSGEKKLCSAAQDYNVVRCGNFGDCRAHHLVVYPAILLDSRK